jgi:hypothetical protein
MNHFIYLVLFAAFISIAFAIFFDGDLKQRMIYGLKSFAQFVLVSIALAWVFYFIPWR